MHYNGSCWRVALMVREMAIVARSVFVYTRDVAARLSLSQKALRQLCESDGLAVLSSARKLGGEHRAAIAIADVDTYLDDGIDTRTLFPAQSTTTVRHLRAV